ncbi:TetR/AcrR family transcriptional regulator [Streptomyces brasiliensis]|uniref:TetR family transcriptional regulator n=1 Tax=Streptomyces brasiliensis TaxID=1954 RepID=A0A917KYH7_9ACTN|nr:TetR/AcrR family transcriptional regulator [Streptomyces brasiliensis]GGJ33798.1 TetR family transcriptional regulator [Streptomyces brasiliensis]
MTELHKGPRGQRRGRGARERILDAAQNLFREQGINNTGMNQLCEVANVSKHTAYQHFTSKDELITEHLRQQDPGTMPEVFDRADLTPRERLLAAFEKPATSTPGGTRLCPFIEAAVEITDPEHPARILAREYKKSVAARLTETAREAGAVDPELLGEQLALLLDGASVRTRTLGTDTDPTAAGIAATLIEHAIPETAPPRPRDSAGEMPRA